MKPSFLAVPLAAASLALLAPPSLRADEFWLSDDVKVEGIAVGETGGEIEVRVSDQGTVTLAKDQIRRRVEGDDSEREALRRLWKEAKDAEAREEAERRGFEAAQRAKGLIPFAGEWLTEKEYGRRIEQEKLALERERLELEAEKAARPPVVVNVFAAPSSGPTILPGAPGLRMPAARAPESRRVVHVGDMYMNLRPPFA